MTLRTTRPTRRAAALAATAVLALGLTACSSDSDDSAESTDSTDSTAPTTAADSASEGSASDGPLSVDKADGLTAGDTVTVTLDGLDTEQNYYVAVATTDGESSDPSTYAGEMSDWARVVPEGEEGGTATFDADGNAEFDLTVQATNEDGTVDCTTDSCSLKLVTDHASTPPFSDVASVPVTFEE
ncbi:hypothetical protein [Corynebacterium glyciniphilum]|uniref:hypothetical protein n=1 Tax=Corynebacterium glyciniphilum TaxID=1404244 RepID=UPI0011AB3F4A|nr:hypothetical protein [Corynebacterium glyciniphilum]